MSEGRHLSPDEIKALLTKPAKTTKARKKKTGFDYEDRTTSGWFKLWHFWSQCSVPTHDTSHDKPHATDPDKHGVGRMCVQINSRVVCRYCYLQKKDIDAWGNYF